MALANESLLDEWSLRFEEFSRSEMTVVDWCNLNLVRLHQFYYWRRKLAVKMLNAAPDAPSFLAVNVAQDPVSPHCASGVTLRMGHAIIDVVSGFDPSVLRMVVAALEPTRC